MKSELSVVGIDLAKSIFHLVGTDERGKIILRVVFQKWRWTEMAVTLGLVFVASIRKEWPMTFIAVRCPHCQSDQIVKRGKTARGNPEPQESQDRELIVKMVQHHGDTPSQWCDRAAL